jgi:hypothetical protein
MFTTTHHTPQVPGGGRKGSKRRKESINKGRVIIKERIGSVGCKQKGVVFVSCFVDARAVNEKSVSA